jgi:diaminopimelate epimerase
MTHFYKMTGSGNDFVMLDGRRTEAAAWPADRIAGVCTRREGVGADGLVILTPSGSNQVRMEYWNADGTRASMCGNAALCSTRLSAWLGLAGADGMTLETDAGTFATRCTGPGEWTAALNLPPVDAPVPVDVPLDPGEDGIWVGTVGVPHAVILLEDLERDELMERGRAIRWHPAFPTGANANFIARDTAGWAMRTYERGVEGETWACGTGAVASALALAVYRNETPPITIRSRGGKDLRISATISGTRATDLWLAGEGRLVFEGTIGG